MVSDHSPHLDETHISESSKIFEIANVEFPGDERGNQLSSIEAHIKASAKELNQEIIDDLIVTTTDKLMVQLLDYNNILARKTDLIAPAGMAITFLATLVASDFKDALSLKASVWEAIFIVCLFGSIIWFIYVAIKLILERDKRNLSSLIQKIKKRDSK